MLKKILAVLAAIGAFFSTIFFLLFRQEKLKNKLTESEAREKEALQKEENAEVIRKAEEAVHESIAKTEAENEELNQKLHGDSNLNSFSAGLELLHKQSESGNKRNSGCSNSGA